MCHDSHKMLKKEKKRIPYLAVPQYKLFLMANRFSKLEEKKIDPQTRKENRLPKPNNHSPKTSPTYPPPKKRKRKPTPKHNKEIKQKAKKEKKKKKNKKSETYATEGFSSKARLHTPSRQQLIPDIRSGTESP